MRHFTVGNLLIILGVLLSLTAAGTAQAQTNARPFLYPLEPAATAPGGPAFSLSVRGTGFASGAVVNWNGSPRATTFVSSSQVTAAITAADIASAKTAVITVTNPPPGGGTSNPEYFQVTFPTTGLTFQDSVLPTGPNATSVVVGDFNGDGRPDVVALALGPDGYVIQILFGNGNGTFQSPTTVFNIPGGIVVTDLAAGDLNGDGKLDLVGSYQNFQAAPYSTGTFALLGNGDGTFQPRVESSDSQACQGFSVSKTLIADVNGDGIADLVRTCGIGVFVEVGNGDGTFREQFTYFPSFTAQSAVVGDFHKSGKLDIVAGFNSASSYFLVMLPGKGDGTFGPASVIYEGPTFLPSTFSGGLESLIAADFYNDGNLDLVFYYTTAELPRTAALSSMRGIGDGTFQAPLSVNGLPDSDMRSTLVPGDFNGDGHIDVAANNTVVLLGNGGGPDSYSVIPTQSSALAFAAADFNGDGRLDLVGIDSNGNAHVLLQTSVPDFMGSINPPGYQDVKPGGTATYTITVTSLNGFAGTIEFSASGLPAGAAATFTPNTLTGSGTVTVTISTSRHTP